MLAFPGTDTDPAERYRGGPGSKNGRRSTESAISEAREERGADGQDPGAEVERDLRQGQAPGGHDPGILTVEQLFVAFADAIVLAVGNELIVTPAFEIAEVLGHFAGDHARISSG